MCYYTNAKRLFGEIKIGRKSAPTILHVARSNNLLSNLSVLKDVVDASRPSAMPRFPSRKEYFKRVIISWVYFSNIVICGSV